MTEKKEILSIIKNQNLITIGVIIGITFMLGVLGVNEAINFKQPPTTYTIIYVMFSLSLYVGSLWLFYEDE